MADRKSNDCRLQALITLEISSVTELASAQQRMRVIDVSRVCIQNLNRCRRGVDGEDNGHQQENTCQRGLYVLSFPISWYSLDSQKTQEAKRQPTDAKQPPPPLVRLLNALHRGKNKLVVREWRQGACWWNLNMNQDIQSLNDDDVDNESPRPTLRGSSSHHNVPENIHTLDATIDKEHAAAAQNTLSMACAEVAGYRLARFAMYRCRDVNNIFSGIIESGYQSTENKTHDHDSNIHHNNIHHNADVTIENGQVREQNEVYMPEVVYFSHDECNYPSPAILTIMPPTDGNIESNCNDSLQDTHHHAPWALMSYFDNGANEDTQCLQHLPVEIDGMEFIWDGTLTAENHLDNDTAKNRYHTSITKEGTLAPCHHFPTTMIKTRHEFGFDEPHPRHGRVPIDECLDYAMMILRDVVMPIQGSFFALGLDLPLDNALHLADSAGHITMVQNLVHVGLGDAETANQTTKPFQYHDMIAVYRHALHHLSITHGNSEKSGKRDVKMDFLLHMLDECINALDSEWKQNGGLPPPLPPVLCHMDLQPQNLAFWHSEQRKSSNGDTCNGREIGQLLKHNPKYCSVAAVMDWEEACYADPRFELLLICRKVLANREQSEKLWRLYSNCVQQLSSLSSSESKPGIWKVGPIEPWLKLETVHSLCTLLLQAMDLLGGGRSPWETKPELWGKIDRERQRLLRMGWNFCEYTEK